MSRNGRIPEAFQLIRHAVGSVHAHGPHNVMLKVLPSEVLVAFAVQTVAENRLYTLQQLLTVCEEMRSRCRINNPAHQRLYIYIYMHSIPDRCSHPSCGEGVQRFVGCPCPGLQGELPSVKLKSRHSPVVCNTCSQRDLYVSTSLFYIRLPFSTTYRLDCSLQLLIGTLLATSLAWLAELVSLYGVVWCGEHSRGLGLTGKLHCEPDIGPFFREFSRGSTIICYTHVLLICVLDRECNRHAPERLGRRFTEYRRSVIRKFFATNLKSEETDRQQMNQAKQTAIERSRRIPATRQLSVSPQYCRNVVFDNTELGKRKTAGCCPV